MPAIFTKGGVRSDSGSVDIATTVAISAIEASAFELRSGKGPWVRVRTNVHEEIVGVAIGLEVILHADIVVRFGLHEGVEAGVEDLIESRALLGDGEGCAVKGVLDHAGVDVGKLGAEAAPQIAVPLAHDSGVVALVLIGEVSVDPKGLSRGVIGEEHRESNVVGVIESEHACCAVIGNAVPHVSIRGAAHGVAFEHVASAVVGDELEAVRGGSPAGDVSDLEAIKVVVSVKLGEAVGVETHQKTSWLVALEDTIGEIEEPGALAGGMGVGHAAVEVACDEALTDRASIPAVGPLGLNGDDFEVTNFVHALDDVDDDASELVVTLGRDAKEGEGRVADVLSEDDLGLLAVLGHAGEGRCLASSWNLLGLLGLPRTSGPSGLALSVPTGLTPAAVTARLVVVTTMKLTVDLIGHVAHVIGILVLLLAVATEAPSAIRAMFYIL